MAIGAAGNDAVGLLGFAILRFSETRTCQASRSALMRSAAGARVRTCQEAHLTGRSDEPNSA
jgi:hypothetical protein